MAKILKIISWVLLTLVGALTLYNGVGSAHFAYSRGADQLGNITLADLTHGDTNVANIIHARRVTAAAFASAYAVLFLLVVLIPYRRGEVWAWWAILIATVVLSAVILLRIPFLGVQLGASVGYSMLGAVVVALLLDIVRLKSRAS